MTPARYDANRANRDNDVGKEMMNERQRKDGHAILGVLLGILCLLFAGYFALMGLFNYVGREPNPGMGSFGVVMCGVSFWGAYRCVRWGFKRKEEIREEEE